MENENPPSRVPITKFANSAVWMVSMRWLMRLIGFVSTIILARILMPADFGLVAMAMIVVALIDALADTGVDLAVIRDQSESTRIFNAAWTIQILQGIFVSAALILVAPFAVQYFAEDRLLNVLHVLALSALIASFRNIGIVLFRRELDFAKDFRFTIYIKLISFLSTVTLALVLRDYRAIVIAMLIKSLITVVLSYVMHSYRPRISTSGMLGIWSFSQWLLISRLGTILNEKSSQIILGGLFGAGPLGYYYLAVELGTIFVAELVMPIRRAFFPNLSKLLQDREVFSEYALKTVGFIAIICFPIGFGLQIAAQEVVEIFLGDRWLPIIGALEWIALYSIAMALSLTFDLILLVAGRPKYSSIKVWSETLVLIPVLIFVGKGGNIELIAESRFLIAVLFLPLMVYFTKKVLKVKFRQCLQGIWRPLIASLVMLAVDSMFFVNLDESAVLRLLFHILLGVVIYPATITLLWWFSGRPESAESMILDGIKNSILRK